MDLGREYKQMAKTGVYFRGLSLLQHADQIGELIKDTGSTTLLDWGCGAGDQYKPPHEVHKRWGVERPKLYDPNFVKHSGKPRTVYDGVLCTDVLEHVKQARIDELIAGLFHHADRFVFASVCCRPASKTFSNGRNLHITLRPYLWWHDTFAEHAKEGVQWTLVETP